MTGALNQWELGNIAKGPDSTSGLIGDERAAVESAKRDRQAFAVLYDFYLPLIYRYCFLRLRSRELAEDATSSTFARAMATIGSCRSDHFRAWLFTIARNVVIDAYRQQKPAEPLNRADNLVDFGNDPLARVIWNDDEYAVVALLSELPAEQAEIVALRLSGLTGVQIAKALGKSQGAIRVAQYRAYSRLRELVSSRESATGEVT